MVSIEAIGKGVLVRKGFVTQQVILEEIRLVELEQEAKRN